MYSIVQKILSMSIIVFRVLWTIQLRSRQIQIQQWKQREQECHDNSCSSQIQKAGNLVSFKIEKDKSLTSSIIKLAETLTGTPCSVSLIIRPEPTSLTESASRLYFSGHTHCNHRRTGGMEVRWTKKPAYVIWYNAVRADSKMATPPFWKRVPSRKFYKKLGLEGEWTPRNKSSQRESSPYYRAPERRGIWRR